MPNLWVTRRMQATQSKNSATAMYVYTQHISQSSTWQKAPEWKKLPENVQSTRSHGTNEKSNNFH